MPSPHRQSTQPLWHSSSFLVLYGIRLLKQHFKVRILQNSRLLQYHCKINLSNIFTRVSRGRKLLFPPVKFSLQNSEISTTATHTKCIGSSHHRMAVSIVLMAAIV